MTQAKLKKSDVDENKKNGEQKQDNNDSDVKKSKFLNDKCIQIVAWLLLTLGLCIIVSTFYLAVNHQIDDDDEPHEESEYINEKDRNEISNDKNLNTNLVSRIMDDRVLNANHLKISHCEEKLCKMLCVQTKSIFGTLYEKMSQSNCSSIDSLIIDKENFTRGILRNSWLYAERTVQELAIMNSNITIIRSDAFNTPMFSTIFLLYWRNLNLLKVESGALLGLHSLKYLMIDSKITCLDRAFFQPVQTTLLYLKLHAGLTMPRADSIFGISHLEQLEYADLSYNNFNGPITEKTFQGTPNLKYLMLARSKITAIAENAFTNLNGKLYFLDLSHNMLTTLSDRVLEPLLQANDRTVINVAMNGFICDCAIQPLTKVYNAYRNQFMDALYCKAPHQLYGKCINEVDLEAQHCNVEATTTEMPGTMPIAEDSDSSDTDTSNESRNLQMRCWNSFDTHAWDRSAIGSSISAVPHTSLGLFNDDIEGGYSEINSAADNSIDFLEFEPPVHEYELFLFENNSVKITIDSDKHTIATFIYFNETAQELESKTPCLIYENPYIVTEPLTPNTTYTFCLIGLSQTISPFNCLPLHVPLVYEIEDNTWIALDEKQFTIGMLCLIFLMSTFFGATIAYFGIKAYPDLLEGSKNVLVIKKSDQTCYVSTISEADYIKKSSLKKKVSNSSTKKSSLSDTPTSVNAPFSMNVMDLERLSSVKSSSTNFEDAFLPVSYLNDEYELPKPLQKTDLIYDKHCEPNTYVATSPRRSPPPLPKRNSSNFSDSTLVVSRFGNHD